jgi:kynurenine formamidase
VTAATWPTESELDALYDEVRTWGRWGPDDQGGALAYLTPERRAAAASTVKSGRTISLAHDLALAPNAEQPFPSQHHMLASGDALETSGIPGYEATRDFVGTDVHGLGTTHLDALCHMFVRGQMYNGGRPADVPSSGAIRNSVMTLADGIVGRGVLLDVPGALERPYLDADHAITPDQLEAAERAQGVTVGSGDILLICTGRDARRTEASGQLNPFVKGLAGLHPDCLRWLSEREVAVLCGDGISDLLPPRAGHWSFPVHQIGIVGMGLHLIDNVRLDTLLEACREEHRYAFLFTASPLRIPGGTGSPINPIALL